MSELMIIQQEYLDWLNQSKLHQLLPFIVLSTAVLIYTALFTKLDACYVMLVAYNPLSLLLYYMIGVMTFTTMPFCLVLGALYLTVKLLHHLKNKQF